MAADKSGKEWTYFISNLESLLRKYNRSGRDKNYIPCIEFRPSLFPNGFILYSK
jgi:hypothetical protein